MNNRLTGHRWLRRNHWVNFEVVLPAIRSISETTQQLHPESPFGVTPIYPNPMRFDAD